METNRCPACHGWGECHKIDGEELTPDVCFRCDGTGFTPVFVDRKPTPSVPATRRIKDNPIIKMVLAAIERKEVPDEK